MLGKIKLKTATIALIAVILTFFSQGTLAYYSTVGKATNVVTSGNIQFIIHEKTDAGTDFPKEGVYIVPGDIVSKRVSIESDCEHPFYLRVKIVYGVDSKELSAEDCFKLNINEEFWEQHDGWYYYKGIVNPGETTPNVFSHVEIVGAKVDNRYIGKTLQLTVVAQAVQSENNPIDGDDTFTASGWPKE
jgi:predicted ribosomally synthesized peptide with SipW-like signal peptide